MEKQDKRKWYYNQYTLLIVGSLLSGLVIPKGMSILSNSNIGYIDSLIKMLTFLVQPIPIPLIILVTFVIIFTFLHRQRIIHIFKRHRIQEANISEDKPKSDPVMSGIPQQYLDKINEVKRNLIALGVKWSWDSELREDGTIKISNPRMFCPNCDLELEPIETAYWDEVNNTTAEYTVIRCDDCSKKYYKVDGGGYFAKYFYDKGQKYIERELRNIGL